MDDLGVQDGPRASGGMMSSPPPLEAVLAQLLPPKVAYSAGLLVDPGESHHAEERAAVEAAVDKRRIEFRCGRWHARRALDRLGIADAPIGRRPDRTPNWPSGTLGSISHSDRSAVAIVALTSDFYGLGVDVESAAPLDEDLVAAVCSPLERDAASAAGVAHAVEGKLLFSIKEAVFKALFPLDLHERGLALGFQDIAVRLDRPAGAFFAELTLADPLSSFGQRSMRGRYGLAGGEVVATLCLTPGDLDER